MEETITMTRRELWIDRVGTMFIYAGIILMVYASILIVMSFVSGHPDYVGYPEGELDPMAERMNSDLIAYYYDLDNPDNIKIRSYHLPYIINGSLDFESFNGTMSNIVYNSCPICERCKTFMEYVEEDTTDKPINKEQALILTILLIVIFLIMLVILLILMFKNEEKEDGVQKKVRGRRHNGKFGKLAT